MSIQSFINNVQPSVKYTQACENTRFDWKLIKTDIRNRSMGNSDKRIRREAIMDFKIVMITMLMELNKKENLGRKTKKSNGNSKIERHNCN